MTICSIICQNDIPSAKLFVESFRKYNQKENLIFLNLTNTKTIFSQKNISEINKDIFKNKLISNRLISIYDNESLKISSLPFLIANIISKTKQSILYFDINYFFYQKITPIKKILKKNSLIINPEHKHNSTSIKKNLLICGVQNNTKNFFSSYTGTYSDNFPSKWNRKFDKKWPKMLTSCYDCKILKDPAYTLSQNKLHLNEIYQVKNEYLVNNKKIIAFNFKNINLNKPFKLNQNNDTYLSILNKKENYRLSQQYSKLLLQQKDDTQTGKQNPILQQFLYTKWKEKENNPALPTPPDLIENDEKFIKYCSKTQTEDPNLPTIPRLIAFIYKKRPDLKKAFPPTNKNTPLDLLIWANKYANIEYKLTNKLFPKANQNNNFQHNYTLENGISIIAFFNKVLGLSVSSNLIHKALKKTNIPQNVINFNRSLSEDDECETIDNKQYKNNYKINLICINPDQFNTLKQDLGNNFFQGKVNVAIWYWESNILSQSIKNRINEVNQIWVASEFIKNTFEEYLNTLQKHNTKVHVFPIPLAEIDISFQKNPSLLSNYNLKENDFIFLFSLDFFSIVERKNPDAIIKAFSKFIKKIPNSENVKLIIKSINGHSNKEKLENLIYKTKNTPNIIIIDQNLSNNDRNQLFSHCNSYISLHRSEGLGLTIAEAMLHEKPVICTAYSGNMTFCNEKNSLLCKYKLKTNQNIPYYPQDSKWAEADVEHASKLMIWTYKNPKKAKNIGKYAKKYLKQNFSLINMQNFINQKYSEIIKT